MAESREELIKRQKDYVARGLMPNIPENQYGTYGNLTKAAEVADKKSSTPVTQAATAKPTPTDEGLLSKFRRESRGADSVSKINKDLKKSVFNDEYYAKVSGAINKSSFIANQISDEASRSISLRQEIEDGKSQVSMLERIIDADSKVPESKRNNPIYRKIVEDSIKPTGMNYDSMRAIAPQRAKLVEWLGGQPTGTPISDKARIELEKNFISEPEKYQNPLLNMQNLVLNAMYATGKSDAGKTSDGGTWNIFKGAANAQDEQEKNRLKQAEITATGGKTYQKSANFSEITNADGSKEWIVDASGTTKGFVTLDSAGNIIAKTPNLSNSETSQHAINTGQSLDARKKGMDYAAIKASERDAEKMAFEKKTIDYRADSDMASQEIKNNMSLTLSTKEKMVGGIVNINSDINQQKSIVSEMNMATTQLSRLKELSDKLNALKVGGIIDMSIADIQNKIGIDPKSEKGQEILNTISQYNGEMRLLTQFVVRNLQKEVGNLSMWEQNNAGQILPKKTLSYEARNAMFAELGRVIKTRLSINNENLLSLYETKDTYREVLEKGEKALMRLPPPKEGEKANGHTFTKGRWIKDKVGD